MICLNSDLKWNAKTLAVAFYTYILHTRVDIEVGDIVFVQEEDGRYRRIVIKAKEEFSFFEMLASAKVEDFDLNSLSEGTMSAVFSRNDLECPEFKNFNINIIRPSREMRIEFNKEFNYEQIQNFARYFMRVVQYTIEHGECKLRDYSMLRDDEIEPIKHAFDKTSLEYNDSRLVLDDFYSYFIRNPHKICISYKENSYTYANIEEQSNQIANMLNVNSVSHTNGVIIYMNRSERILSSILGIMKCAAYYLPIDISTPIERVKDIVSDSKVKAVLVDSDKIVKQLTDAGVESTILNVYSATEQNSYLNFDKVTPSKEDACYMIYTSGTTGKPKGVMVRNRNVANFVSNNILDISVQNAGITAPCIIAPNKVGFDAFVGDMLLSVSCGFKIAIASDEELDNPHLFINAIKKNRVNIIQTTPTRLNMSILSYSPEVLKRLKVIACGGEPLLKEVIKKINHYAPDSTLINVYGPTETTVWSAAANITKNDQGIGVPAQNTRCYILNRYNKFVPNYETGILYIAGDGLGCYCFDKEKQNEKYIHVDGIDEQIYNSGDTSYLDSNYYIIYGSRADSQVKINGVRIELGDIESVAKKSKSIKDCAAAVKEIPNAGRRLVLYYLSNVIIKTEEFRSILSELPDAYIPSFFVKLEKLPLTSSNKIDRKSLPVPEIKNNDEIILPRTELEKALHTIVKRLVEERFVNNEISSVQEVSINKALSTYGINSNQKGAINSYLTRNGFYHPENHKIIKMTMSIAEIAEKIENLDDSRSVKRNFPAYSFDNYKNKNNVSSIFLTGGAGFLGTHVLASLLKNTKAHIICLYHNSSIKKAYEGYNMDVKLDESRITYVYGSLSEENLGLSDDDIELVESADSIINCAACVKYYADEDIIYRANVLSVKNLISFAIKNKIVLNHVSTLSVLGNEIGREVTEKDFWHGQNEIFMIPYVESKFTAENEIILSAENGLKYRIFRVGRLSWRKDGVFQHNCNENEFFATLKIFELLGLVPEELLDIKMEISPIDGCANAIVALSNCKSINGTYHIMNENLVTLKFIINSMNKAGCNIKAVPMSTFLSKFNKLPNHNTSSSSDKYSDASVFKAVTSTCCVVNDMFNIEHNEHITNKLTIKALPSKFKWPEVDEEYFIKKFGESKN